MGLEIKWAEYTESSPPGLLKVSKRQQSTISYENFKTEYTNENYNASKSSGLYMRQAIFCFLSHT